MISLMDNLLKQINLDFKFTAYKVLAMSKTDGMLEFVPESKTIQDILKENKDRIDLFLRGLTQSDEEYEQILDTYIRSCAGYCTITYLLAVGDRHLENLLIDNKGHLFHVDFGFIFGKNPPGKNIMAPPIRICKEMVEGMGGNTHPKYEMFK
jgi:phosphatidylinositol 3-kinase